MSDFEWSAVVSAFTLGGLFGGLAGGRMADVLGFVVLVLVADATPVAEDERWC